VVADTKTTASKTRKRSPSPKPATDATTAFFQQLGRRQHEPAFNRLSGSLRFDVAEGPRRKVHWLVSVNKGDITVSKENRAADCVVRAERSVLDDVVSGRKNAMAAILRGSLEVEGEAAKLLAFQRIFPGPRRRSR